jgi:DNA polymerase type B, organellar and viral
MIYESLRIPKWLESGIKPNHRGSRVDKIIYGGDTETVHGKPNSMQFYSEDIACNDMIFCDEKDARKKFLKWCSTRKRKVQHVVYVHNLAFDLIEFLWGTHERLIENSGEFDFSADGFTIRGIYGAPTFCTLRKGDDICVHLCDSFSFYRGSLAQAAMLYCPELPKLRRPLDIGKRKYTASSTAFVEYAMRDAQVTYHIGKSIEALHHEFDLKQCVSIADMAARIFRHRFLTYTIPQPTTEIVHASLDAYHGGKNNLTVEPGWYRGVKGIDISSAYPDAMRNMPAFSDGSLYRPFRSLRGKNVKRVPEFGVYSVSGKVDACKWPCVFDHSFKRVQGGIDCIWLAAAELNEGLRSGELHASKVIGTYYDAEADVTAPALRGFCDDFYARKQNEKDKIRRYGYKLILNSISGKFIQTRKRTLKTYVDCDTLDVGSASELVAGGMFHPFIAASITAHTRARIHQLEHKYEALHTATDGIFTQRRPDRDVVSGDATKLGQLTQDAHGELLIVRNKCYIMYDKSGAKKSKAYRGKRISKYALHGFQGSVYDLERMVKTGARRYKVNKPNRLKEALARGLTPNEFVEREMNLNVGEICADMS